MRRFTSRGVTSSTVRAKALPTCACNVYRPGAFAAKRFVPSGARSTMPGPPGAAVVSSGWY
jgi:hypothetical protein